MNKLCYRIVFNKTRGMCMVVQETARSRSKGPGIGSAGDAASNVMHLPALRRLALLVGVGLAGIGFAGAGMAQIVANPHAPGQQRATVLNAANGVLQVNIQTPSGAGVSRNVYSQFDVPKSGAILNNSRTSVQSQLGGWVQGNPWLGTGTARVILNEVNSSNPSRLQGYVEVAGARAETIIANPAGIVVDGGGFINVSRATLTTGSPVFEDGRVKGYAVQRGQIVIDGAGLDASKTDYTALIARSLQVNAGLWAQRLNIITGVNEVEETEQGTVTQPGQAKNAAPAYAVDVARLGGMYANQIYLVGTEAGVGVHNAGAIGAAAGDLVVTAAGRLENSGTVSATRDVRVDASGIDSQGRMQAGETLALHAGSMTNAGLLASGKEAQIAVQGAVDNSHGRIEAPRIDFVAASLRNAQGNIVQSGAQALAIDAADVINTAGVLGRQSGSAAGGTATAIGGGSSPDSTDTAPGQDSATAPDPAPSASPASPMLADGRVQVGMLDNTAGAIASSGAAVLRTGSLGNHTGHALLDTLAVSGPNFDNTGGVLTVLQGFDARAGRFVNDQGTLKVAAAFTGTLGAFSNREGLLQAAQIGIHATGLLDNSGGTIQATHDLALQSSGTILNAAGNVGTLSDTSTLSVTGAAIDNGDGRIVNTGSGATVVRADAIASRGLIGSNGDVHIAGHTVRNDAGGTVTAQGDLNLVVDALFANAGRVDAGGRLQMLQDGAQLNNGGTLAAQGAIDIRVASVDNGAGTIATAAGTGSHVALAAGGLANRAGTIVADGPVMLTIRGSVDNERGHIRAGTGLSLDAAERIENRSGDIESAGSLLLHGMDIGNDAGRIAAVGLQAALIEAGRAIESNGSIGANGHLTLRAQTLANGGAGTVSARGDLDLAVSTAVENGGAIGTASALRLDQADATLVNHGSVTAGADVYLNVERVDNQGGRVIAGQDASIMVRNAADNSRGAVQAAGSLAVTTNDALRNQDGTIEALGEHGTLTVRAGVIDNAAGRITGIGDGTATVDATGHVANSGLIAGNGRLHVSAVSLDNAGTISAGTRAELAVTRQVDNSGTISAAAGLNMHQASLDVRNSGTIVAGGSIDAAVATLDNANGRIATAQGSGGDVLIDARSIGNHDGLIAADHNAIVKVANNIDGRGGLLQAGAQLQLDAGGHVDLSAGGIETLSADSTLQVHAGALRNEAGHIVNAGRGETRIQVDADLLNSGRIAGNGELLIAAERVTNAGGGDIVAAGPLQLQAHAALDNAGSISSGGALTMDERQAALGNHGTMVAAGDVMMHVATIDNAGGTLATAKASGASVSVQATSLTNRGGRIVADRTATLGVDGTLENGDGTIAGADEVRVTAAGAVVNDGGAIETASAGSSLTLHAHDVLNADGRIVGAGHGTTTISVADKLVNGGLIAGNGNLDVQASIMVNPHGATLTSNAAMSATIGSRIENAGTISSGGTLDIAAQTATVVNSGQVIAAGAIGVASAGFVNDGGHLATASGSGASILLDTHGVSNRGGAIQSDHELLVRSIDAVDNTGGVLQAAGSLVASGLGTMLNDGGVIEALGTDATLSLHAGRFDNGNGRLTNVGSGATTVTVDGGFLSRGTVAGNGSVTLHVGDLQNGADGIVSGSALHIDAARDIGNHGTISSRHAATVDAAHGQVTNHGTIVSGGGATLAAARIDNDAGQIATTTGSAGDIELRANDVSNVGGHVVADGALTIAAFGALDNRQGTVHANRAIHIDAGGALGNREGTIEVAGGNSTLSVRGAAIDNDGGRFANVGIGATEIAATGDILNGGTLGGNGTVGVRASTVHNRAGGSIASGTTLEMRIDERLDNAGRIDAGTTLDIGRAMAQIVNTGEIAAAGDVALHGAAIINDDGRIITKSGAEVVLRSESTLSNRTGVIDAGGALTAHSGAGFDNTHGQVQASGAFHMNVDGAVTNAGGLLESVGAESTLTLRADAVDNAAGRIVNTGVGGTRIDSATAVANGGTIGGNGALSLSAQDVTNTADGAIVAGTSMALAIGRQLDTAGTIGSGGDMRIDVAAGRLKNTGKVSAGASIDITAGAFANQGGHVATRDGSGAAISVAASSLDNTNGAMAADGILQAVVTGTVFNDGGTLHGGSGISLDAGAALFNASGIIDTASGALAMQAASIDSSGRIVNAGSGATAIQATGAIVNSGTVATNGALAVAAQTLRNTDVAAVGSGTDLELAVGERLDNAGTITSGGALRFDQVTAALDNSGHIGAQGSIDIVASSVTNRSGQLYTATGSAAAVTLRTHGLDNTNGTMSADGLLHVDAAGSVANTGGLLHGGTGTLLATHEDLRNGTGTIESGAGSLDIAARSIDSAGRIVNAGTGQTAIVSATDVVNSGTIAGNGALALSAQALQNLKPGAIGSGGTMDLAVNHRLDNAGTIGSGMSLRVSQPDGSFSNAGTVEAGGPIEITARAVANQVGQIDTVAGSGAAVKIDTGSLWNEGGTISADGMLGVDVANAIANDGGTLHGGTGASLHAGGLLANGIGVIESAAGTLDIRAQSISSSGRIVDAGTGPMRVESGTDLVNAGMIAANGGLALTSRNLVNTASIFAGGPLDVSASTVSNASGKLYTASGSGMGIQVNAGSIDNAGGTVSADGLLGVVASAGIANAGGSMHGRAGVNVRAGGVLANGSGTIESVAGALTIQTGTIASSGRIVNAGTGTTSIISTDAIVNAGSLAGNGELAITAASLQNTASGTISSGGGIELAARERLDNAGTVHAAGTLHFDQAGASVDNSGRIGAAADIDMTASAITNRRGQIYTTNGSDGSIRMRMESLDNAGGTVSADSLLRADVAGGVGNDGGRLHGGAGTHLSAGGALLNGSGIIEAGKGTLDLQAASIESGGRIVNAGTGATTIGSASGIVNAGTIAGNGALTLSAQVVDNKSDGAIGSGGSLELAVHERMVNAGAVNSAGGIRFDQAAATLGNSGTIGAGGDIALTAAAVNNIGGRVFTASGSGGAVDLHAGRLDSNGGVVSADGSLHVDLAGDLVNDGGVLHGGSGLALHAGGTVANGSGTIEAAAGTLDIAGHAVDSGGRIVNAGTGLTSIESTTAIVNRRTIVGNGALALSGQTLQNTDGATINSAFGLELALTQRLDNAGIVSSGGGLRVDQKAASVMNTGSIAAAGAMDIAAASLVNRGGKLVTASGSGATMRLATGSLDNSSGVVSSDGQLRAAVAGDTLNSAGTLHGGTGTVLEAGGILANAGGIVEAARGALQLQAASLDNTAGRIVNAGDGATTVVSASDIDNGGTIAGNGTVAIAARTLNSTSVGVITSAGAMELAVRERLANAGTIGSGSSLHIDQAGAEIINTGRIGAARAVDLSAAAIANLGGQLYTSSDSGAEIQLKTGSLDNTGGTVSADGALHVQISGSATNGGVLYGGAGTALDVSGALHNGSGTIEAAANALDVRATSIESSGRIVNGGAGVVRVDSATSIVNSGTIAAHGELALAAATLQNDTGGTIGTGTGAALELAVRDRMTNTGTISSGGGLHVDQAAASLVNSGNIGAAGTLDIATKTIDNSGGRLYTASGSDGAITLHADTLRNVGGTVATDSLLTVAINGEVVNDAGILHGGGGAVLHAGGTLANGSGTIEARSGMLDVQAQSIGSNGRIVNGGTGVTTIASQEALANRGIIGGNGRVDLHAAALHNEGGQITSGGDVLLDARQALVNTGTISSAGKLTFDHADASFANSGQITAGGAIHVTTGVVGNDGGRISTARGSGGDIVVSAASLSNQNGSILADGNAILSSAGDVANDRGVLQAEGSLVLTAFGRVGNDGGTIETLGNWSTLRVEGNTIDNGSGRISNAGSGDTLLQAHAAIDNRGAIAGMGRVFLSGQGLSNASGATLASGNNLTLGISQLFANYGKVNSAGSLTFEQAGAAFTNGGDVFASGNTVIRAGTVNNDGGRLGTSSGSGASLILDSLQLSNQGGRIATDGDLQVNTHLVVGPGELFAGRDLVLRMDGDFAQGGTQQVHSNRDLTLAVTGNIYNASTFATAGTLALTGQNISNGAGATIEGRNVVLNAHAGLSNAGEIDGGDTLDIRAAAIGNSGGIVGGNVTLATGRLDNGGPSALIGATGTLNLGVSDVLNNVGGATLYSSGDMAIGGQCGCDVGAVNNISSTIEAGGDLTLKAASLRNVRENVQIVQVETVDETVNMSMPDWRQYGDNHNSFERDAANYAPHEVYFVRPADILEDQIYVTPVGNTIHRAVIRTHANDSAFYVASSGLYNAYGAQSRLTLSEGTRVLYYMEAARVANPDQGGAAGNAIVHANSVTDWDSSISFSNHYGNCSDDCIRLVTQPDYTDPRTTRIVDDAYAQAPEKEKLEKSLVAHHAALEDQLAPGVGAAAQILAGGNMHLTVGSTLQNQFADIKARGLLVIDGTAAIDNVGTTLYRTHVFDGTWKTYAGDDVKYQRASISEAIGSVAGVLQGGQGVSIAGKSFRNIDVSAGTVGNIRDSVNVIGSGIVAADGVRTQIVTTTGDPHTAGVQVTAGHGSSTKADARAEAGAGESGTFGDLASATAGVDGLVGTDARATDASGGVAGTRVEAGAGLSGERITAGASVQRGASTVGSAGTGVVGHAGVHAVAGGSTGSGSGGHLSRSVVDTDFGLGTSLAPTGNGNHVATVLRAAASGVRNAAQVGGKAAGSYANDATAAGAKAEGGTAYDVGVSGAAHRSGIVGDGGAGGTVAATSNAIHLGDVHMTRDASTSPQANGGMDGALGNVVKVNPGGLFLRNPDSNGSYLFETRPQFANQRQWISSDYLLKQLAFEPATTQKRLGDGFYEQRLVREQLAELTGHALYGGASDDGIYTALLTNAVSVAREFGLRPGIALSAEQVSRLTSDIAWLETQTVMLPDGHSETVLVPKVYLAHVGQHAVQPNGALVAGNDVAITTTDSIVNRGGMIDGGNGRTVLVAARDIVNQGGAIKGDAVALAAGRDVRNESLVVTQTYDFSKNGGSYASLSNESTITARGTLDILAGRDLSDVAGKISAGSANLTAGRDISFDTIKTGSTYRSQIDGYTEKDSAVTHQLSQIATTGSLRMAASGDLKLNGTQVAIGTAGQGSGQLLAGGAVTIASVINEVDTSVQNDPHSKQYDKQVHENQTVVGTDVSASGSLTVGAGLLQTGALTVTGSSLAAGDTLKLTASDSVSIVATQERHLSDTAMSRNSHSLLKSKTTQQADYVASTDVVGSILSGKTVEVTAGKDINVLGSGIAGEGDVRLSANGSVNIEAATRTVTEQHHSQVKESGFLSGDGFGFSIGTRTTTTDQSRDATTQSGQSRSVVGAVHGNLDIHAGDAIKVGGSDLAAGSNMTLDGRSVVINAGEDDSKNTFKQTTVQNGLSFAVGGSVVNAIHTAQRMSSAAAQAKDARFKALAAAAAAMTANDTVDDLAKNGPSVRISVTAGHSESESTQVATASTHTGSALSAGGNVTISATGGGQGSNLDIIGSDVHGSGSVALVADNHINLLAAQDTDSQHSKSRSISAAFGVAANIGTSGVKVGVTGSASASRGNVDGDGTTQIDSHVIAGEQLTIASGADTNLRGAVASGRQVVADIKGNLNIESLQDTAKLDGKRQSASASGTLGAGAGTGLSASASVSQVHNDFASVAEQGGIRAGEGGFQVRVVGNTDLNGGVISSSDAAIKDGRNSLVTGSLSYTDIHNHDKTKASGISLSGNVAANQNGGTFSPGIAPGIGHVSGEQSSVTRSGISGGELKVADRPGDVVGLNRDVTTGTDTSQALVKGWNGAKALNEVGAQMDITSAAMPRLAKDIGDYAENKVAELKNQGNAEEAAKWEEGGAYRVAAHAALGAMGGGVGGALGATVAAEAGPTLTELESGARNKLEDAGLNPTSASLIAKLLVDGTVTTAGTIVGGSVGASVSLNADVNNRQLHQREYDFAKKYAKLVAQKLGVSKEEAEGRIVAEILRNSDKVTAIAAGDKHDYEIRALLGCQNLNCNGRLTDENFADHNFNREFIAPNLQAYHQGKAMIQNGMTDSNLIISNVKKDPVGVTLAGAGMVGLGYISGGARATVGVKMVGAGLGALANYIFQPSGQKDWIDVSLAGVTGFVTSGAGLISSGVTNVGGSIIGSGIKGENPNSGIYGAGVGTVGGYIFGKAIEIPLGRVFNSRDLFAPDWIDMGYGVSRWNSTSPIPGLVSGVGASFIQEPIGNKTKDFIQAKKDEIQVIYVGR